MMQDTEFHPVEAPPSWKYEQVLTQIATSTDQAPIPSQSSSTTPPSWPEVLWQFSY